MNGLKNEIKEENKNFRKQRKMYTQQSKIIGHREGSLEKEFHSDTGLLKKYRNISHKQPNSVSPTTGKATTKTAQSK